MVRNQYEHELERLKEQIVELGGIVDALIRDSVVSLKGHDMSLAQSVIERDGGVDNLACEIEKLCLRLIALQQPMAVDLRTIVTALKIQIDLERMGDLAVDIARVTIYTKGEPHVKPLIDIPRMSDMVREMLDSAIRAFHDSDGDLAYQTAEQDDLVDGLYDQVRRELLTYLVEDPKKLASISNLLFVSKYLERIGDHAVNLCENVIYMATGDRVHLN
ncbi:MAG: phosphate transport system regulatory protein PhoU [Deltaproteobacteria bacterium]|nr:MAG: phosphate transport system regulatory protein PhoU [Deltaproteobacteria bacterium]